MIKKNKKLDLKLVGFKAIGNSKVESVDVDNKYIAIGMPSINRVNIYKSSDLSELTFLSSSKSDQ